MDDESIALLRLMAKMNAEVVRPAQMLKGKNLPVKENGYHGDSAVCNHGEPSSSGVHGLDVPVQGSLSQLPLQRVCDPNNPAVGNGVVCEPDLNLQPKKQ